MKKLINNSLIPHWDPRDTNFTNNMRMPIHRWFRFPAGFSAVWVDKVLNWYSTNIDQNDGDFSLLDPFSGSGTSVLSGEFNGVKSYGFEAHPFLCKVGQIKLLWDTNPSEIKKFSKNLFELANTKEWEKQKYPELIERIYSNDVLNKLNSLRSAWEFINDDSSESKICWLGITSILRQMSHVGTAPWQYVLPNKKKIVDITPYECYQNQIAMMLTDIENFKTFGKKTGEIFLTDSRFENPIGNDKISLVLTSPPYANNFDYADATRIELSFWGYVEGWGDLKNKYRKNLVRSCSQHVSNKIDEMEQYLSELSDTPIIEDITDKSFQLSKERLNHGGKKQYHVMIPAYFSDLYLVWKNLRKLCKKDSISAFVIGDSAPYGVHIPVDKWLGELAVSAGFNDYYFEKIRDRNVKWKMENRKHQVPLHEGILWVK